MTSEEQQQPPANIYKLFFEYAADPLFVLNMEGNFVEVNQAACDHLGYSRDEILHMRPEQFNDAGSRDKFPGRIAQLKRERLAVFEAVHIHRDGTLIPVEMHIRLVEQEGQIFLLNICRVISERMKIESVLRRERDFTKAILDTAGSLILVLDRKGRIVRLNNAGLLLTGYHFEEICGQPFWDVFLLENERAGVVNAFDRLSVGDLVSRYENHWRCKDGSTCLLDWHNTILLNDNGDIEYLVGIANDITERKNKEKELIASEARFRQLFEKSFIGITLQNDKKIFAANPAFCKMFGYTQDELSHISVVNLTHPDYVVQTKQNVQNILTGKLPAYTVEKKYVRKNGEVFWGHAVAVDFAVSDSQTRHIMGMVEDITDRVEREEKRFSEIKVQRDLLVREVHHRIKNNLQGVVGLLREHAADHPELTGVIESSIGRIYSIAIIHGLQAHALSEEVDFIELMQNIVNASGANVAYEGELQHSVLLDRDEAVPIALVLNELITNASKHCSINSSATIRLETRESDTIITITNHYETNRQATTSGHGLDLVKSLLPRKSAKLLVTPAGNIFSVELTLSPPVTRLGQKGVQ